jgi:hypothetical protein
VVSDSLIVVERGGRSIVSESRVVALDLDSLSWRSLPSLPTTIDVGDVTTDGTSVYVAGVAQDLNNNIIGLPRWPRLFVSEPGDPWTELASVPIDGQAATIGWVNDLGLLAWNYALEAALWVPGAGWRPLDDVPIPAGECYPSVETTSDGAVGHCFQSVYFDGTNLVWSPIREPYFGKIAVTPDAIYAVMDTGRATSLFIAMDLPPPPID